MKPWVLITPGDPDGIGPEIVWKAWKSHPEFRKKSNLLCVGARKPFDQCKIPVHVFDPSLPLTVPSKKFLAKDPLWLIPAPTHSPSNAFLPGFQAGWSIQTATKLVLKGQAAALVTGPISKERLNSGGYPYPGHTEFLAKLCKTRDVTMMLANDQLRISLVTTHLALKDVPKNLTRPALNRAVNHTLEHLISRLKMNQPKIAVAALNPHAGENGLFGDEEKRVLSPALALLRKKWKGRAQIAGPLPADTLFALGGYDAVVCMYHDQGLIPVKLLDFPNTVNITLGLPIIRTSVDHGTGFDIAGKGIADPSSLISAIHQALRLISTA